MRGLLLDKLRGSELLVVNRAEAVNDDESHQLIHKLVRQASRRCDIAYESRMVALPMTISRTRCRSM